VVLEEVSTNLKDGKHPTISSLAAICAASSAAISYLADGNEIDAESQQLLKLFGQRSKNWQQSLLRFLEPDQND
jgi:hypothetical protein